MSLRSRLLLSLGAILAIVLLVTGAVVAGLTRASLVDQVDDQLRGARLGDLVRPGGGGMGRGDPTGRRIALLVLDADGTVVESYPSGFGRAPDPLPSLPDASEPGLPRNNIVERASVDGTLSYRVLAIPGARGVTGVLAAPLREVDAAMSVLLRILLVVGGVALAALLLAAWLIVRRGLGPLESVTRTADRIAAGDLSQRAGIHGGGTEVTRLGAAFDSMIDQIQTAFEQQQRALAEKERSENRLRRFVADASHELRTPLTALRGYAELYRAGGLQERAALDQAMARIGGETNRMTGLVEDMLLLARLDQGRPLRREEVDLSQLVGDAVSDATALEPDRPLTAVVEPGVTARGDEDRLRQVVGNLLANVRVHTAADTPVEVRLATRDGMSTLTVADRGPGVPAGQERQIFDRFYRSDAGRSRDRGGSGLGLAIAQAVVSAHGGVIAHSATPGGGATFSVQLPLVPTGTEKPEDPG
jgi:two-component system, OmpR family, sensor kinase